MNRSTCLLAIALLAAGCGGSATAGRTASAPLAPTVQNAPAEPRVVELRHFYLLSPGPNAKLVITRSDVADASR